MAEGNKIETAIYTLPAAPIKNIHQAAFPVEGDAAFFAYAVSLR